VIAVAALSGCGKDLTAKTPKIQTFVTSSLSPAAGESFTVGWKTANVGSLSVSQGGSVLYVSNDRGVAGRPNEMDSACHELIGVGTGELRLSVAGALEGMAEDKGATLGGCP
jgi:hypothetical protein